MTQPLEKLSRGAASILGRPLAEPERAALQKYLDLLIKWQKSHRLVGSSDPDWIVQNLFLDSLLFLHVLPASVTSLLDLGSGAGVPGIPIKIVRPHLRLVLVESRRRRASFLATVVRELQLEGARVVAGRAEDFIEDLAGRFDAVVMRCAGDLENLLPIAARLVTPSGVVVASGPPEARPLSMGDWVMVGSRRFLVYRPA